MTRRAGTGGRAIRVGVTGKTGSGKTTVSALVALSCASRRLRTLAVDTDDCPNLALSLGLGHAAIDGARSVPRALLTGRGGGSVTTAQLVRGFGMRTPSGVTLLHAMPASSEVGACCCPAHASARSLLASALDEEADVAVLDIEAGLEHLERQSGTVAHTDVLLVVVEPSRKSSVTAARMIAMAASHGIDRIAVVGNKADTARGDAARFATDADDVGVALAGVVPLSPGVVGADRAGAGLDLSDNTLRASVAEIVNWLLPAG